MRYDPGDDSPPCTECGRPSGHSDWTEDEDVQCVECWRKQRDYEREGEDECLTKSH